MAKAFPKPFGGALLEIADDAVNSTRIDSGIHASDLVRATPALLILDDPGLLGGREILERGHRRSIPSTRRTGRAKAVVSTRRWTIPETIRRAGQVEAGRRA